MSVLTRAIARTLVRNHIMKLVKSDDPTHQGELRVEVKPGHQAILTIENMPGLDASAVWRESNSDSEELFRLIEDSWRGHREVHPLGNNTTLCDMWHVFRDYRLAVAVLQYGQIRDWWKIAHDQRQFCEREELRESYYCLRLTEFRRPPRPSRRKRRSLAEMFALDLFPNKHATI